VSKLWNRGTWSTRPLERVIHFEWRLAYAGADAVPQQAQQGVHAVRILFTGPVRAGHVFPMIPTAQALRSADTASCSPVRLRSTR
jgi:hypothetical protein